MNRGRSNVWLLAALLIGACVMVIVSVRGGRSTAEAESAAMRAELNELKNLIGVQNGRLADIEKRLDQQRLAAVPTASETDGSRSTGLENPGLKDLAEWVSASSVVQSNTVALLARLLERTPEPPKPGVALNQRRAAFQTLQVTSEREFVQLDQLKQATANLLFELQVPDDIAVMDAARALDIPSLSRYWPYFESKRRREILQNLADALEMKLMQDELNLNQEEARSPLRE